MLSVISTNYFYDALIGSRLLASRIFALFFFSSINDINTEDFRHACVSDGACIFFKALPFYFSTSLTTQQRVSGFRHFSFLHRLHVGVSAACTQRDGRKGENECLFSIVEAVSSQGPLFSLVVQ